MRIDNLSRISYNISWQFSGKKTCTYTYICICVVLKAPKEWWNLVLQNAKDSKDIYNFAHSASHIMQAKNSTKCSLSHFKWDHIRVLGIGQQIALPETDKSPVKMNSWKMRFPFDLLDLLGWPIFRGYWGYFSFRAGTWQEKRAKVQNPQRSINISGMPELTYYTWLHYVLRVETWTPHLPSRCAQHPSNISGKSEGEVMPAAISPAWKQRKETTQGLSPSILSFLPGPPALAEKFHHP